MPKAKWGTVSADDIDGAERQEARKKYSGEMPRGGTYRAVVQSIKQDESKSGNAKALIFLMIDGSWRKNHKDYDGCPIWDHLPVAVTKRLANFLDAIGASGSDFTDKTIVDENGYVTKLGSVGDPKGIQVFVNVKRESSLEYPDPQLKVEFNGYAYMDEDPADSSGSTPADGEEPPF